MRILARELIPAKSEQVTNRHFKKGGGHLSLFPLMRKSTLVNTYILGYWSVRGAYFKSASYILLTIRC